jgi:hypothetical protein
VAPEDRDKQPDTCAPYLLLRNIEIVLRELIITQCTSLGDNKWWKRRVPNDVQQTAKRGQEYERDTKWLDASSYHPIYYTDFADVRKILISNDNWRTIFRHVLYNKDQLSADLQSLEPLRNNIAHNRLLSSPALKVLISVHDKIRSTIGTQTWEQLTHRQTVVQAAVVLPSVLALLLHAREQLQDCQTIELTGAFQVTDQWWWDPDVLGGPLDNTDLALSLLSAYNLQPRGRGQGHILEAWIVSTQLKETLLAGSEELQAILTWSN